MFSKKYQIKAPEADLNKLASASAIFRILQDVANHHIKELGFSADYMIDNGLSFFLGRISVEFYGKLYAGDRITVTTWPCDSPGISFNRCFEICSGDALIAKSASVWALVNHKDSSLIRVKDSGLSLEYSEPNIPIAECRFRIPPETELKKRGSYTVSYQDADMNGHMNNTRYPDMLCGFIDDPFFMKSRRIKKIKINFLHEALLGKTIDIYSSAIENDIYFLRSVLEDGTVNTESYFEFDTI